MPNKSKNTLVIARWRGRCGVSSPADMPDDMAAELVDVVLNDRGQLITKRKGSDEQTITGTFTGHYALYRFVPGQSDIAAELLFVTQDATTKLMRVAAGTAASALTLANDFQSPLNVNFATLNGKCYVAFNSDENRLHVFDPDISTTVLRRAGLETPAAATVADSAAAGTYAATLRYYRIQWVTQVGGTLQRASNLGASVSFTPVGNKTAAVVTRPTAPSEGETHWRVWGSADNDAYYLLSTTDIAIATTTHSDTVNPSDYDDNDPAPAEGFFTPAPSAKFLCSTGDRLLMFGAYETAAGDAMAPRNGRVWHTPVLDSSDYDDDERIDASLGGYTDVSRDAGSEDRGIVGPLDDRILVGQSLGLFLLIPTGNQTTPYRRVVLSRALGMVSHISSFLGEDEFGRACIYFLEPGKGPYRLSADGLQWLGFDLQDLWTRFNPSATIPAVGIYDNETRRVRWSLSLDSANTPSHRIVFNVREGQATQVEGVRGGWTRETVLSNQDLCVVMFSETVGATMSRNLKPYSGGTLLIRYEDDTATDDNGTAFQGYGTSKAFLTEELRSLKRIQQGFLQAEAQSALIRLTLNRNFSQESKTFDVSIAPVAFGQTHVRAKFESAEMTDAYALQITIGDPSAISNEWAIDQVVLMVEFYEEP